MRKDEELKQADRTHQEFLASPAGRARTAYLQCDLVFQYQLDVMTQQAIIVPMTGSSTAHTSADPTDVLNSVAREGWDLVNGSFVFLHEGEQSRDKFMSSGQNVAVKGRVLGYYLLRRAESRRQEP